MYLQSITILMKNHQVVVVTVASTGPGLAVAVKAAQQSAVVNATMRNLAKRDALDTAARHEQHG